VSEQHKQILYFAFLADDVMKCVQEIIFSTVQHDDNLEYINFVLVAPPPSASVFHLSILPSNRAIYEKSSFILKFMQFLFLCTIIHSTRDFLLLTYQM
jgi:hypothetical protein